MLSNDHWGAKEQSEGVSLVLSNGSRIIEKGSAWGITKPLPHSELMESLIEEYLDKAYLDLVVKVKATLFQEKWV